MAYNTVIQQGHFTSDGLDKIINLRSDIDWVEVYNLTNIAGNTQWAGTRWYWQRGMDQDDALQFYHGAASQVSYESTSAIGYNGTAYRGISLIDSSDKTPGAAIAVAAGTNATRPVYTTADTGILVEGSIVRIQNTAQLNLNGFDFTVDAVTLDTNFRLRNTLANVPGIVAGAAGTYRYIAPNETVYNMFNPKKRVIANITQANPGVVTTLVNHTFQTGDKVRIKVPEDCDMVELNDQLVTVTRTGDASFTIGIDTSAYTAFVWPALGFSFTPAEVIPVGIDSAYNTAIADAVENTGFIGMILGTSDTAGIALGSPGGTAGDAIKWRAGKSFAHDIG